MQPSTSAQSIVARAAAAFAREMPCGERRREQTALARSLEQTSEASPHWTKAFARGLDYGTDRTALSLWMSHASRESMVRSRRSRAWVYPLVVFGLAFAVMMFLCPIVIEPFRQTFIEFGLTLPAPTLFLMFVTEKVFGDPVRLLAIVAGVTAAVYGLVRLVNRYSLLSRNDYNLVAGNSGSVLAMASFTEMLAHLLGAGISLPAALEDAAQACGHNHLATVGKQLAEHLRMGNESLLTARAATYLPGNVLAALQPFENAPPNLSWLRDLSVLYEERVTARTEWAGGAIGVLGVLVVGLLVAFIVVALFMPLVELISGLS